MTGYTVHTGSTLKFSEGWDRIFPGAAQPATKRTAVAKSVKKMKSRKKKPGVRLATVRARAKTARSKR